MVTWFSLDSNDFGWFMAFTIQYIGHMGEGTNRTPDRRGHGRTMQDKWHDKGHRTSKHWSRTMGKTNRSDTGHDHMPETNTTHQHLGAKEIETKTKTEQALPQQGRQVEQQQRLG